MNTYTDYVIFLIVSLFTVGVILNDIKRRKRMFNNKPNEKYSYILTNTRVENTKGSYKKEGLGLFNGRKKSEELRIECRSLKDECRSLLNKCEILLNECTSLKEDNVTLKERVVSLENTSLEYNRRLETTERKLTTLTKLVEANQVVIKKEGILINL